MKLNKTTLERIIKEELKSLQENPKLQKELQKVAGGKSAYRKRRLDRTQAQAQRVAGAGRLDPGEIDTAAALDQIMAYMEETPGNQATGSIRSKIEQILQALVQGGMSMPSEPDSPAAPPPTAVNPLKGM